MWRFENNILYASNGTTWPARPGGLHASSEIEPHKRKDNRWLPIPHYNSLYAGENSSEQFMTYIIGRPYTQENLSRDESKERMDFVRDVSDAKSSFCKGYFDDGTPHQNIPGHTNCVRYRDTEDIKTLRRTLKNSMQSGHTWFVPLTPKGPGVKIKRNGFGIHPDGGEPGSKGCIAIIAPDASALFELLKNSWKEELKVKFSTPWWMHNPSL